MTLAEHLAELRRRLIICLIAVGIGGVIAFVFYPEILDFLTGPYRDVCAAENLTCPDRLVITDPLEGFAVRMKVTGYGGLVLALPVVLWQLWRFITPGLYDNEKRYAIPFVVASVVLFLMGARHRALDVPESARVPRVMVGRRRSPLRARGVL